MYRSDIKHDNPDLAKKLAQLYALKRNRDLDLSFRPPYLDLLEKFGNPHLNLPPTIHVAGTNGKGSTIAILRSILQAAGLRVHVYTSPHLVRFNERIVLAGQQIDDALLESLIDEALAYNADQDVSFFEITTAMAFAAFARTPADIVLLETGLGGRLDCTNVIKEPMLSIITPVSLDHQDYLGDTIKQIAEEKAGIMKTGVPCLITNQPHKDALDIIQHKSEATGSPLHFVGDAWGWKDSFRFSFQGKPSALYPKPNLIGAHQLGNAATAVAALHVLQDALPKPVSQDAFAEGLATVHWPARLQNISAACPVETTRWEIILDGGHNADAAQILLRQIEHWRESAPKPLHIICTMMRHKDAAGFLRPLSYHAETITAVPLPDEPDAFTPADLAAAVPDLDIRHAPSFSEALIAITHNNDQGRVLICGSLYLAGYVLQMTGLQA